MYKNKSIFSCKSSFWYRNITGNLTRNTSLGKIHTLKIANNDIDLFPIVIQMEIIPTKVTISFTAKATKTETIFSEFGRFKQVEKYRYTAGRNLI